MDVSISKLVLFKNYYLVVEEEETIKMLYEKMKYMYDNNVHSVPDWIASIGQPYIRPIVRAKLRLLYSSECLVSVLTRID